MARTIAHNSKETISQLIRKEFDSLKEYWQESSRKDLIQTAKDFGLTELAEEMQNDLN